MTKYDHDELASSLASHLLNENRMVWEDIPAGRSGSIRPDVYTVQKSFSKPSPISYEIKVSVSDFRSDITSGKWKGYLDFSDGVVFAVPRGLITKNDLPKGCGLMTFNGEFWNTVKKPTLHNGIINSELLLKLLIAGEERQSKPPLPKFPSFDEVLAEKALKKKFGEDFRRKIRFLDTYESKVEELERLTVRLSKALEIPLDRDHKDWYISNEIAKIEARTSESTIRANIAKELENLKKSLDRQIDWALKNYVRETDE